MESTNRKTFWLLPLLLLLVLGGVFVVRKWQPLPTQITSSPSDQSESAKRVEITIDLGTGEPRVLSVPWKSGLSVQEALTTAEAVTFSVQGECKMAFLTELAGQPNEGDGGRNWQFEVNSKWSDSSFGVHMLQPGDSVLWEFKK